MAREQLRRTAIQPHKCGDNQTSIAQTLGIRRPTVSGWLSKARLGQGVKEEKRGRRFEAVRRLKSSQEDRIRRTIVDKTPDQKKLPFALWNAQAIRILIKARYRIPVRSVRNYLKRWGFTSQRPMKRALEQKPTAVKQRLKKEYPQIETRAKAEGAEINLGDETAVSSVEHYPLGYAPKGKTPVLVLSK